jgi:hypothetical protein
MKSILTLCIVLVSATASAAEWTVSTFAGTGVQGFSGDGGPATSAQIDNPFGIVRGPDGALWICEYTGQRIRKVNKDGTIQTMAGTGKVGYTGDGGPALQATFNLPHEIRFDKEGNYYLTDMKNHAIRRVDAKTGVITTFAGNGTGGYSGDGGPASKAQLKSPHSLQFGAEGSLYICDIGNHVIRKVDPKSGIITTFAGTGKPGATPDGAPIARWTWTRRATFGSPHAKATRSSSSISRLIKSSTSPAPANPGSPATAVPRRRPRSPDPRASPSMRKGTCGSPTAKATPSAWWT